MASYGAYNAGLPCKNTACKSHGKPHPNCQCYGSDMAEGGEIKNFCDSNRSHKKECQYYADGGEAVPQDDVPDADNAPMAAANPEPAPLNEVPVNDMPDQNSGTVPDNDLPEDIGSDTSKKYSDLGSQIGAGVEGVAQGVFGPFATGAEKILSKAGVPGLSDEDISGRASENPWVHGASETAGLAGSFFTGFGEVALAEKMAAKYIPKSLPVLGKIGSKLLKGFVSNAAIGAGNETSKALLGQTGGDPKDAVSDFILHSGLNGIIGMFGSGASSAVDSAMEAKIGSRALSWLAGLGAKASGEGLSSVATELRLLDKGVYHEGAFKSAYDGYEKILKKGVKSAIDWTGFKVGQAMDGMTGGLSGLGIAKMIDEQIHSMIEKPIKSAADYVVPSITHWLSEGVPSNIVPIINYATKISKGNKLANSAIEGLFTKGNMEAAKHIDTKDILNWIDNGGTSSEIQNDIYNQAGQPPQGFAEGGEAKKPHKEDGILHDHPISVLYPDQNILLQATKGRVSNYLNSLKPQKNIPKLAFDSDMDQKDINKSYMKAVDIAANPISIMHKIKDGTIETDHVKHINSMYPELTDTLHKRITKRIIEAQINGEKPSYKVRQGLSLFMGTPLSGEMTPKNILAAQAVFKTPGAGQSADGSPQKKMTAIAKSSQALLTPNQASAARQQRQG